MGSCKLPCCKWIFGKKISAFWMNISGYGTVSNGTSVVIFRETSKGANNVFMEMSRYPRPRPHFPAFCPHPIAGRKCPRRRVQWRFNSLGSPSGILTCYVFPFFWYLYYCLGFRWTFNIFKNYCKLHESQLHKADKLIQSLIFNLNCSLTSSCTSLTIHKLHEIIQPSLRKIREIGIFPRPTTEKRE